MKHHIQESQEISPFLTGDHKAARNKHHRRKRQTQKYIHKRSIALEWSGNEITGGLKLALCKATRAPLLVEHAHPGSWSREVPMNQVLVACEAGHCPNEAVIGRKSYEVMAVDISRGVYGPSLDILWVGSISLISVPS